MAIRKFRKKMKPVIWVVTIFFLASLIAGYMVSFRSGSSSQIAFKLNGRKVALMNVEKNMAIISENYKRASRVQIEPKLINTVTFNDVIDRNLLLGLADDMKIDISNSDVKKAFEEIEKNFPDKKTFKRAILAQGYTSDTLKKEIKENMILQKASKELVKNVKVSESEIHAYYEANKYSREIQGREFKDVKARIEQQLTMQKQAEVYSESIANARKNMKLEDINKSLIEYKVKDEFVYKGVSVTNVELFKNVLNLILMTGNGDIEKATKIAKDNIESQINLIELAKNKGIKIDAIQPVQFQVATAVKGLYNELKGKVVVDNKELKKYFEKFRIHYDTQNSVDANIAVLKVEPTKEDDKQAQKQAEKLLKKVNVKNFVVMAKKYSDGPSGPAGGALGTFKKGDMVKPFETAAFSGKVGEIYPKVVKTQFGYHIIYIQAKDDKNKTVTASHILIMPKPSEKTLKSKAKQVKSIIKDLQDKTVTFADLKKDNNIVFSEKLDGIPDDGYIPGLGYNKALSKHIYDSKIGEIKFMKEKKEYIIYEKLSQIDAKKAEFDKIKKEVEIDYINYEAQQELKKIEMSTEITNSKIEKK